jgi:Tfp pilus assembly protein PilF
MVKIIEIKKLSFLALMWALIGGYGLQAHANDFPADPSSMKDEKIAKARQLIEQKNWSQAEKTLLAYVSSFPDSADGYNLLGFSYRKQTKYDEAFKAYKQALSLNPNHRGANEYIGEAYVETGRLDLAKVHLAKLEGICGVQCEEYLDLKKMIDQKSKK